MNNSLKDKLNCIEVPLKLNKAIEDSIKKAKKDKTRKKIKLRFIKLSTSAALLIFVFGLSVNLSPTFANSLKNIPIINQLSKALQMNLNGNIEKAVDNGLNQKITMSKSDNGVKFTIDDIVADSTRIIIFYTMEAEKSLGNLENLYLKDLKVTDKDNNLLVSNNTFNPSIIKVKENDKDGNSDYLRITHLTGNKDGFEGMILSSEKSNKDFFKTYKAHGSLEIYPRYDTKNTPNEFKLQITKLVETAPHYVDEFILENDTFSKDAFKKKYSREPVAIEGNWNFDIKLDEKLKNAQSKEYTCNKEFKIEGTTFNIESIKISPLRADMKITWKNGSREFEPVTMKYHLEDNKGNQYARLRGRAYNPTHTMNIVFDSSYFDNSQSLYLIVDEIKYVYFDNRRDVKKFGPVKIKIK